MRVLVTGAAGNIGRVVTAGLSSLHHDVVGVDLVEAPEAYDGTWHVLDCTDPGETGRVLGLERPDAVVHLAGNPGELDLPGSLASHALTTASLLDAMVAHRVGRMVYASSNHTVGHTPRTDPVDARARPRPDTFYGVAKVTAEALLSLYADRYGLDTVACRIGSFRAEPATLRQLSTWLSHGDCVRMVQAALTAPSPGHAVLYGTSANTRAWWDLASGRALGYEPQDDAEAWADRVPEREEDIQEGAAVGGDFTSPGYHRPAFDR